MDKIIAHKGPDNNIIQFLTEHLKKVSELASNFASQFNNSDWAYYAGIVHDLGKAFPEWQKYIRGERSISINHREAGAQYAFCEKKFCINMF